MLRESECFSIRYNSLANELCSKSKNGGEGSRYLCIAVIEAKWRKDVLYEGDVKLGVSEEDAPLKM